MDITGDEYIVDQIFYTSHFIRVSNAHLWSSNSSTCYLPQIRNLTLEGDRLQLSSNNFKVVLLSDCSSLRLKEGLLKYRVDCNQDEKEDDWVLAMYLNDTNLSSGIEACHTEILAPVDQLTTSSNGSNYVELLKRGFALKWTASNCSLCEASDGRCGFDAQGYHKCYCPDRPHFVRCNRITKKNKGSLGLILATAIPGVTFILIICLVFIIWRRKRWSNIFTCFLPRNTSLDIEDGDSYFGVPVFSYKDLEEATHNFDASKELGDGGYGAVYHGKLRDGREVAVKRLYQNNYKRVEQFMNEIEIITRLRHRNLVLLYGSTSHRSSELLLVYEYIPNGTVADHLHGDRAKTEPLTWPVRMNIAIETASALSYLHKSDIIHRDVKTNNILLDSNFCVKVADFGLSRLFPTDVTHVSTAPQGTPGYVDPEYYQCYQLTDKSDVYSFGVVLIELISSMPAVDISRHRNEINLANLAINRIQRCAFNELIDPSLGYENDATIERMTTSVAELGFRCLQLDKELRPTMDEVLEILKQIQGVNESGMPPPSPESENVVLLKNNKFLHSPVGVTDQWLSSRSTTPNTSE